MKTAVIIRYNEIWLKGRKRSFFERTLCTNITKYLAFFHHPFISITRKPGRIIIDAPLICKELCHVPGIASFSFAYLTTPDLSSLKEVISLHLGRIQTPFCIRVQRLDKVGLTSRALERDLGTFVAATGKKVSLSAPQTKIGIEIFSDIAYVFFDTYKGVGGLPLMKEPSLLLFLSTEADLAAGKLLIKRGCLPTVYSTDHALFERFQKLVPGTPLESVTETTSFYASYDFLVTGHMKEFPGKFLLPLEGMDEKEWRALL